MENFRTFVTNIWYNLRHNEPLRIFVIRNLSILALFIGSTLAIRAVDRQIHSRLLVALGRPDAAQVLYGKEHLHVLR